MFVYLIFMKFSADYLYLSTGEGFQEGVHLNLTTLHQIHNPLATEVQPISRMKRFQNQD